MRAWWLTHPDRMWFVAAASMLVFALVAAVVGGIGLWGLWQASQQEELWVVEREQMRRLQFLEEDLRHRLREARSGGGGDRVLHQPLLARVRVASTGLELEILAATLQEQRSGDTHRLRLDLRASFSDWLVFRGLLTGLSIYPLEEILEPAERRGFIRVRALYGELSERANVHD